mgnify:CR=1 FL=1
MTKYKCGHETRGVLILDSNPLSMSVYIEWALEADNLNTKKQCFDCYCREYQKEQYRE